MAHFLAAVGMTLAALGGPAAAQDKAPIALPSGAQAQWIETIRDTSGGTGLTYRFRFLVPDLASRVPSTSGPASDAIEGADRGPIDIDTETAEVTGDTAEDGMIDPATLDPVPAEVDDQAEAEADAMVEEALPTAPDVLAQDPVHDDIVWLCQEWVLPRIANPGPRPRLIVISLSDKNTPFGSYDPDALQLFEAFSLSKDRMRCIWEPW